MFEMPVGISERDALAKRKESRSEDSQEQTEQVDEVSEDTQEPTEETPLEVVAEVEESSEEEVTDSTQDDDEEELYVDLGDREITLSQIKEWEQGNLRQADYTRKTQELSDSRKEIDSLKEQLASQQQQLKEQLATANAIVAQDKLSDEEVKELKEYEPEKYIAYMERQEKVKSFLDNTNVSTVNVQEENQKLFTNNPTWINDKGEQSSDFQKAMALMNSYATANGYSNDELRGMQSAHHIQTLLDAAKYRAQKEKNVAETKKVRKAPVATKPKQATKSNVQSEIQKLTAQVKRHGRPEDFVKLRKLQKQLNN